MKEIILQEGFRYFPNIINDVEAKILLSILVNRLEDQGYPVKSGLVYAHYGKMWAVNKVGNYNFPVFGKHLKKDDENRIHPCLVPSVIDQATKYKSYDYYTVDQNCDELLPIDPYIIKFLEDKLECDMSLYDSAIINAYSDNSYLAAHIDNTEDKSASIVPIISINLLSPCTFKYSDPNVDPNAKIEMNHETTIHPNSIYLFGGRSRYIKHSVTSNSENVINLSTKYNEMGVSRVNITLRRSQLMSPDDMLKMKSNTRLINRILY